MSRHCVRFPILGLLLALALPAPSARADEPLDPYKECTFLILASAAEYPRAKAVAQESCLRLGVRLDLRGFTEHRQTGLTLAPDRCRATGLGEHPCYFARGKYDDGAYVSIEYSSAYPELKPGLYLVVAYSGEATEATKRLAPARAVFPDARLETLRIYMPGE